MKQKKNVFQAKKNFYLFAIILVLLATAGLQAQTYNKPGNTSVSFLKMSPTPRGEAMGSAIIGIVDDASSVFSNPAGLMNISNMDIQFGRTSLPADIALNYSSIAKRFGTHHVFALSVLGLRTDEMKVRTPLQPEGTGQTFHSGQYAFGLSYARNYTDKFKVGFTGRILDLNIVSGMYKQTSWSADIGLQYHSALPGILEGTIIAVAIRNFGPQITYAKEGYGLPLNYVIGAAKPVEGIFFENDKMHLAANWNKALDEKEKAQVGMEYIFDNMLEFRCGYKFASGQQGFSTGMGVRQEVMQRELVFRYAYSPFGVIGNIHRFSIGVNL
jgi:hypothetical protein